MSLVPMLSVVMTVYNGARHVREATQSVLQQTFGDFEFIIVDNASTDNTVEILRNFNDSRIRILENRMNEGQTKALNRGIEEARGRYLARMDADDVCQPKRFETQLDYMRSHPDASLVGAWHYEIDESGRFLKLMRYPTNPLEIKCHLLSDGNLTRRSFAHPTAFFRTEVLKKLGGYNEEIRFAQDYELWTRMLISHEIHNVDIPLLRYRASMKSTSNLHREEMTLELDRIVAANIRRLWPEIKDSQHRILVCMLRNRAIEESHSLNEIHSLFDELFRRLFSGKSMTADLVSIRERIKIYYMPRLLSMNPLSSFAFLGKSAFHQPTACFDAKFQKNVLKVLLGR